MTVVTPTDRPMSVHNRYVIEVFWGVIVLCSFFDFCVGIGAFVIGLSQISSLFPENINLGKNVSTCFMYSFAIIGAAVAEKLKMRHSMRVLDNLR